MSPFAASSAKLRRRVCAIAAAAAIACLSGCVTAPPPPPPPPPPPVPTGPVAGNPILGEEPGFLRLPNMSRDQVPVRVGVLLPFSNGSAATRALASSMLKAAQLALFDANNANILLITADEGSTPEAAANGARALLAQGAEIIVGPLFSQSVNAVAPIARDRGVPVIAFSSDRTVAGDGVYLLSFQPENEVKRIVSYAASQGHMNFAALVPQNAYGDHILQAFQEDVVASGGHVADVERYDAASGDITIPAAAIAKSNADAVLIAQGGSLLHQMAPTLTYDGIDSSKMKLLGTGVWDDPSIQKDPELAGGWFPAPMPDNDDAFNTKYRAAFGASAPQLATLSYDAISLAALLASGVPYHRFTAAALDDPNGFAGVNGIFRFQPDGTSQRGLAILAVTPGGFTVADPAPTTFEHQGS